jgi:hypothetical protein
LLIHFIAKLGLRLRIVYVKPDRRELRVLRQSCIKSRLAQKVILVLFNPVKVI